MRWGLIVLGVVMALLGGIWFFQGIGILLGSVMTSQPFWAVAGAVMVIAGAVVAYLGTRRKAVKP